MADITPPDLFPNYALLASTDPAPAAGLFIPLTDLPGLDLSEANATTGDGRAVLYGLVQGAFTNLQALPTADRPVRLTLTKVPPTGIGIDLIRQNYTLSVELGVDPGEGVAIAPEA